MRSELRFRSEEASSLVIAMYKTIFAGVISCDERLPELSDVCAGRRYDSADQTRADAPSAIEIRTSDPAISRYVKPSDQDATGLLVPGADPDNHLMLPFIDHLVRGPEKFLVGSDAFP